VCVPCKMKFSRRRKLDEHNRIVHDIVISYSCKYCQKTFSRRDRLATHLKHCKYVAVRPAAATAPAHSEPSSATDADVSIVSDNGQLPAELGMLPVLNSASVI